MDKLLLNVEDGKYTVQQDTNGRLVALRYGEPWRDCVGDKLILALAQRIEHLETNIYKYNIKVNPHAQQAI